MKRILLIGSVITLVFLTSCISIPKETITLSQTLGNDLEILHNSHRNMIYIHFDKLESEINTFIDDVYAPYIIHFVLKGQLEEYKNGNPSIYTTIILAGEIEGKEETQNAINDMYEFQEAARIQINKKRKELLLPVKKQRSDIINKVNKSYENALYANSTITAYLQSVKKVKDSQRNALSMIGLDGADTFVTESLIKTSEEVNNLIEIGKEVDINSDKAYQQIEEITNKIKEITNKK